MTPQRHHIQRVVLDVAAPQPVLEQVETPLRHWQRERLPALLDAWLSAYAPADQLLRLDQLVVEITDVDFTRLDREWTEKIEPRLRETLRQALSRPAALALSPAQQAIETLLFFLQTGRLPWHSDARATDTIPRLLRELTAGNAPLPPGFWQLLRQSSSAFRRLVQQVPDEQLAALLKQHLGVAALKISDLPQTDISLQARLDFWRILTHQTDESASIAVENVTDDRKMDRFQEAREGDEKSKTIPNAAENIEDTQRMDRFREAKGDEKSKITQNAADASELGHDKEGNEDQMGKRDAQDSLKMGASSDSDDRSGQEPARNVENNRDEQDTASSQGRLDNASAGGRAAKRGEQRMLPTDASDSPDWNIPAPAQDTDAWPLPNAGLVMIAPYLPALWTQLGWVKGGTFTSPETRTLAIQMTAFLADGQESIPPEYQLILPKILCGLQPDDPFEPQRALSVEEKAEGEALLSAVLEQAPGLGLKSIAGLRSAFLWREGLLRSAGTHWVVQVAPETHDIMLSRVPWGFQIVKSAWMRVAVFVDWGRPGL